MGRTVMFTKFSSRLLLAGLLLGTLACESDSPTAPVQNPQGPADGAVTWIITLTASPEELQTGSDEFSTIRVSVRRADNGQVPPNGATVLISVNLGDIGSRGSGLQTASLSLLNGVASFSFFPGDTAGTALIQAILEQSVGQVSVSLVGVGEFVVFRVQPNIGSPSGGDLVVIQGSGFLSPVEVTFEEDAESSGFQDEFGAEIVSQSFDEITVLTPPSPRPVAQGERLFVDVVVTIRAFTPEAQSRVLQTGFSYAIGASLNQPVITSVTPTSGPNEGGTRVVINGDGFDAPIQVLFGQGNSPDAFDGVEATIESVSSTQVVVVSPPATAFGQNNLNQRVNILVRNLSTGLAGIATAAFEYGVPVLITSIAPGEGPWFGQQLVTVFGQGFDEPVAVEMGGVGQIPLSVSGTEIVVRTVAISTGACSDQAGETRVTNIETGDTNTGPVYVYRVAGFIPLISSLTPASGPQTGGTIVTIIGVNLQEPLQVVFGDGRPAAITSLTPLTTVVVVTPPFPDTLLLTEACDDDRDGTMGERFLPTAVDVTVTNLATTCADEFQGAFTYLPSDISCRNDAGPPPPPPPPPPAPVAACEATVIAGTTRVQFQDRSSGPPTSWAWDFESDGIIDSSLQNPLHDYGMGASGMTFTVTLTVRNVSGTSVVSKDVMIP